VRTTDAGLEELDGGEGIAPDEVKISCDRRSSKFALRKRVLYSLSYWD